MSIGCANTYYLNQYLREQEDLERESEIEAEAIQEEMERLPGEMMGSLLFEAVTECVDESIDNIVAAYSRGDREAFGKLVWELVEKYAHSVAAYRVSMRDLGMEARDRDRADEYREKMRDDL